MSAPVSAPVSARERVIGSDRGVLVLVELGDVDAAIDSLHEDEARRARELPDARRRGFVAGRVAMRRALVRAGAEASPVASDDRGAPLLPRGFSGSLSHKDASALAWVVEDEDARVGVDLERVRALREGLERRILVAEEIARLPSRDRDLALLVAFSVKESIYKAVDPYVRRYVAFHEAVLQLPSVDEMRAGVALVAARALEGAFVVDATARIVEGKDGELVVTTARARPASSS